MKKAMKIIGIILAVIIAVAAIVYFAVLRYPKLKDAPKLDKWYRVESSEMKDSEL